MLNISKARTEKELCFSGTADEDLDIDVDVDKDEDVQYI